MKRTVFLLLFLLFASSTIELSASSQPLVFDFDNYQIRMEEVSHQERGRGYRIVKVGENPFTVTKTYLNQEYYITNCVEVQDYHIFYGYTHNYEGENYYDSFALVLDHNGNERALLIDDFGELEEVREVVLIDNIILIRIEQIYETFDNDMVFNDNIFLTYDLEFNKISELSIDEPIYRSKTTELLYLYDFDYGGEYSGALTSELEILDDTLDITNNQVFLDTTTILFFSKGILNGEVIENGVTIDYPGNYELEYAGYTYRFVVDPIITGVLDNEVYQDSVTPYVKTGKAFINNDLFVSGTEITEPGNYTLKVEGLNGYEKLINFSINSSVSGVLNDQTYEDFVQIEFEGEGYLNNTYIESPYTVTEDGEYLLKIKGEGNYLETYHFTVEKPEEESSIIDYVQKYDVVFLGVVVIIGGIILKKK